MGERAQEFDVLCFYNCVCGSMEMALRGSNKRRATSPTPLSGFEKRSCSRFANDGIAVSNPNSSAEDGGLNRNRDSPGNVQSIVCTRKERRIWTKDLHQRFVRTIDQLGGRKSATPKNILERMGNEDGLTSGEIKSHLHTYRHNVLLGKGEPSERNEEAMMPSRPDPRQHGAARRHPPAAGWSSESRSKIAGINGTTESATTLTLIQLEKAHKERLIRVGRLITRVHLDRCT